MKESHDKVIAELTRRLRMTESALQAIQAGQVDTILSDDQTLVIRLAEAEAREIHLAQVLRALRHFNRLIAQENDPQRLIEGACANLTATMGYPKAWIALLDEGGRTAVRTAFSGFESGRRVMQDRLRQGEFPDCVRAALDQEDTVIVKDPISECQGCPLRTEDSGQARLIHRLAFEDRLYGMLSVSVPVAYAQDPEERTLFREACDDLAFALYKIDVLTDREEALAALRESEDRFRALFECMTSGVAVYTAVDEGTDFVVQDFNSAAERIENVSRGDVVGRRVTEVFPDVKDYGLLDVFQRVWATGTAEHFPAALYRDAHGRESWRENRVYRLPNGELVAVYDDITERKQTQAELLRSEQRLGALMDAIPDLVWLKDQHGVYRFCNRAFERLVGAREAEIVGKTDHDLFDKELAVFFQEHDREAAQAGGPRMNEELLTFADDGYQGHFETIKAPLIADDGHLIGVLGVARDISERKAAERALRESERRYISAQRMGRVGNWEYDIHQETFWGSDEAKRMYGLDPQRKVFSVDEIESCTPERDRTHQALMDLIEKGTPYDLEFEIHPCDGSPPIIIKSIAQPVRDPSGTMIKIMGVIQDITAQKQAEKEQCKLENQLHQSQRLESVGRLAGGVAHDFNNILSVIIGYAELAVEEVPPDDPLHGDLVEILHAAQRSRDIIRQLLAFARKETIAPEVLDLNDTVEHLLKMLRRLIGEDIDLAWRPAPELWSVKMDPSQVDQILANLCVNARDAIKDVGKVTIETRNISIDAGNIDGHPWLKPGDFVLITVSDDGCGMARETLDNIFEPFFTTKEVGRGTGLGLSTVYGITKQNNGFINVSSKPGKGTRFRIYLPRNDEGEADSRRPSIKTVARGSGETVLVVEDDPGILKLTARILEPLNYTLLAAGSPSEAIALAANHDRKIDLLITDVVMPDMNGRDLSKTLTQTQPNLRTLFMSGYTADLIAHRGVLDSDVHFIHKPFSKKTLAVKVREALDA